jgi:hypothetical protein
MNVKITKLGLIGPYNDSFTHVAGLTCKDDVRTMWKRMTFLGL